MMRLKSKTFAFISAATLYIAGTIFSLLLISSLLLLTHTGNQVVIYLAKKVQPRFSIELIQGSFLNAPVYSHISWVDSQASIKIESASYRFDWSCLWTRLCLSRFTISNAHIVLEDNADAQEESDKSTAVKRFELPIALTIQAADLTQIHFSKGQLAVDLTSLHLQADAHKNDVTLNTAIQGLQVFLPESAGAKTQVKPLAGNKNPVASMPALVSQNALPEIFLPFNLYMAPFDMRDVTIIQGDNTLFELNSLNTEFSFIASKLAINAFSLDLPETDLTLSGDIDFTGKYPLSVQLSGRIKEIKALQPAQILSGQVYDFKSAGDLSQLKSELWLSNKITMQLSSQVNLFAQNLPYSLSVNWQNIRWPLTGSAQYASKNGRLQSSGTLDDYRIKLSSDYQIESLPAGSLSLQASGGLQQLKLEPLISKTLDGAINLSGQLNWQQGLEWQGELALENINLAPLKTQYTGVFSGLIKQKVNIVLHPESLPSWQFVAPEVDIKGTFLARPFALRGALSGDDQKGIYLDNVFIHNAENELSVNGRLATQNDLDIKLNIIDLSHLLIGSTGKMSGSVNLQGPKQSLSLTANLQGDALHYEATSLKALTLSSQSILSAKPKVQLQLDVDGLTVADHVIDSVVIEVDNMGSSQDVERHKISLSVQSELISSDLQIKLAQDDKVLKSTLSTAILYFADQTLSLLSPFELIIKPENTSLAPHCWQSSNRENEDSGTLCFQKLQIGKAGEVSLVLDSYLLSRINQFLPNEFQLGGSVSADAHIKWQESKKPVFDISVHSPDMQIIANSVQTADEAVSYALETFTIKLTGREALTDLSATIYAESLIDASIQGQIFPYKKVPDLTASVELELPSLSPFAVLVPEIEKLAGQVLGTIAISGPINAPLANGEITISNVSLIAANAPIQINRLHSRVLLQNSMAKVEGEFYTEQAGTDADNAQGKAYIKGQVDWQHDLQGDIHLVASKMKIDDYEKIDLLVSPDLHLLFAEHIKLGGKIVINKGTITVKELTANAVSPSKDIIVVDIELEEEKAPLPIEIDLLVALGERLKVEALGLNTTIKGNLLIRKAVTKELSIDGELNLIDGSYTAMGQQLVLRKSSITFQGTPETPYVSIEAIRSPKKIEDNVTAGIRVTGTPDALAVVIFSDPAMSQQDALSYLTRGKSLQNNTDSDGNGQMTSMLIGLSTGATEDLISGIGEIVGIEDLSLSSSGTGEEQSVDISGYIAPGVELSYGVGVFDSFNVLAIRYEMFEDFFIEASSGVYQAIDAYYEFEWE